MNCGFFKTLYRKHYCFSVSYNNQHVVNIHQGVLSITLRALLLCDCSHDGKVIVVQVNGQTSAEREASSESIVISPFTNIALNR